MKSNPNVHVRNGTMLGNVCKGHSPPLALPYLLGVRVVNVESALHANGGAIGNDHNICTVLCDAGDRR